MKAARPRAEAACGVSAGRYRRHGWRGAGRGRKPGRTANLARLAASDLREIDPADPTMARRYGLSTKQAA